MIDAVGKFFSCFSFKRETLNLNYWVRGKIQEIIKENYAQIDEYSSYDFRPSLLEVAINEQDYENLARFKNWEQLLRDKVDKIIDENYEKISDIQQMYEESFFTTTS